jgi:hypothetical protein
MNLPRPKNQMAHLLRDMLRGRRISEQSYPYNRFRGSISDLKNDYGCPIRHEDVKFINTFGRPSHHRRHYIHPGDRIRAIKIYERVNNK